MKKSDTAHGIECRYKIQGCDIIDTEKQIHDGKAIYIRELLDSSSHEFNSSKINAKDRLDIVGNLGLKILVPVLEECFKMKGYENEKAFNSAIFALGDLLRAAYPELTFIPLENEAKSKLVLQLIYPSSQ